MWIDLLQDFSFKIIRSLGMEHDHVDALNTNPIRMEKEEEFENDI